MKKLKSIEYSQIKDYKSKYDNRYHDVKLVISGIFDTSTTRWTYYVSANILYGSREMMTPDISNGYTNETRVFDITSIATYARKFETIEGARKFIYEFRIKWETGSNDTTQEARDDKLNEILDGDNQT